MLKKNQYNELGNLMKINHNGDRVWKDGSPNDYVASDIYLKSLILDLRSEDLFRVERAQLYN
ncbi:MAG: hypothetical protein A2Y17_07310 [Clostridiales bacterium GWF2_38_85]|nr:MAG: hypothetical protein A2Y17_07310 [Clostridiales bacterium GWF2_38_85]HBL84324.1 hypothetical protein [Clostridiales bacterium]